MSYIAPPYTAEMEEIAAIHNYDPNNTLGNLPIWDLRPDDTLAAAGLIHDLLYIKGGTVADYKTYDSNFDRDANILAEACDNPLVEVFELSKAKIFAELVYLIGPQYRHLDNWHTEITWKQAIEQLVEAQGWIDACAKKIGQGCVYGMMPYRSLLSLGD